MVHISHLCLNPRFTLRNQMMLSFGITAVIALGSFIMIGLYTASNSGMSVQNQARAVVTQLVTTSLSRTAQYVAETMTKKFNTLGGAGSLLAEVTRDRFVGYPNMDGWKDDAYVPFFDSLSERNVYPLDATPLPLDWEIVGNVNEANAYEHLPDRPLGWYSHNRTRVDTSNAAYYMQGTCDPQVSDPTAPAYYPGCTEDNNNLQTGGVVRPTFTNWHIYQKSKDIAWVLKPLFEQHNDVKTMGIFFANYGAGARIGYPAMVADGNGTYESIGCEWMYTAHPRSQLLIASREQIENCHPRGEMVPNREYNPLERAWCRDQVEKDMNLAAGLSSAAAHNIMATGPYRDALSTGHNLWVLTFGRAVFDRLTEQFIACTLVDVSVVDLYHILVGMSDVGDTSEAALVRWDDLGSVVVATQWDPDKEEEVAYITDNRLNLGVTADVYHQMLNMVNYSSPWDPAVVHAVYHENVFESNGKLIMMHPVPNIPFEYDPVYTPEYLVVISIDTVEAFGLLDEMDALIDDDVTATWQRIGMVGAIGFGVVILCIAYISHTLTKPLRWMQQVAGMIVEGTVLKHGRVDELDSRDARVICAPRTEVTKLLVEFEKMIKDFRGDGAAEVADLTVNEVKNRFEWRRMYEDIYPWETTEGLHEKVPGTNIPRQLSITKPTTPQVFDDELTADSTTIVGSLFSILPATVANSVETLRYNSHVQLAITKASTIIGSIKSVAKSAGIKAGLMKESEPDRIDGPPFVNRGDNIVHPVDPMTDFFDSVAPGDHSFLFWWTTLMVGTPILVTAILISLSVASDTTKLIPLWLEEVKNRSFQVERDAIITVLNARRYFGEQVLSRFIRDLHVYSRVAGWLLFGALNRTNSFTKTLTGGNQCKLFEKNGDPLCPFLLNPNNTACDCEWNDPEAKTCTVFNETSSRHLQYRFVEGQSDDADAMGARMNSSFPLVGMYPNATNWWNESSLLPGAYKQGNASGYETTYDRVRVTSAMALIDMPLYNYNPGIDESKNLGTFIGFEADGMMTGYTGCAPTHVNYPHWKAASGTPREELCPVDKYGYDARCRGWYDTGKAEGGVYVTPPYPFAASSTFAGSATFSLVEPFPPHRHVGQVLVDFLPDSFMRALKEHTPVGHGDSGFPIIITPQPDGHGHDTLVGPGYTLGEGAPIRAVLLLFDEDNSTNRNYFEDQVARKMRNGESGTAVFTRATEGGGEEEVFLAYGPVHTRTLSPTNASVFAAGCTSNITTVYSIGFGLTMKDLVLPFTKVENKVNSDIDRVKYVSLALIVAAVLGVLYMTYTMCLYISEPILVLIAIVKSIQKKTLPDELPKLEGGSCEIYDVYESLEQLCKIVRFSNAAFLRGDRTRSYKVVEDALALFEKMENQKAVGVANNNLGTMVLQEQMEKSSTTVRSNEVYFSGMKYFNEAIRIGTYEYQNADFDDMRGEYVNQLANRYFNRGLFFIINREHPSAAPESAQAGVRDLERAKSLDMETRLYWRERGQTVDYALVEFGCILRRARGMLTITKDSEFEDVWGIERLVEQAEDMLYDSQYINSKLFETVSLVARKQQTNDLKIQNALRKDDKLTAAKLAIKMLVEDEYIIDTAIMNCVTALNKYYDLHGHPMQVPNLAHGVKRETRRGNVDSMRQAKNVIFCLDYSGSMAGERMNRANQNLRWVYDEHCLDKDHVGFVRFNHAVDDELYFDLARKGGNQETHEAILAKATDAEGGTRLYAALNKCTTMAIESSNNYDSWIIALTDGESAWDFPAKEVIARIAKHNNRRGPQINVIIVGFEVPSQVSESVAAITSITEKSLYIDVRGGLDEMDNAFETVVAVITGTAITMETF